MDLHVVLLCEHPLGALFLVIDGVKNHRDWRGAPTYRARARGSTRLVPTELAFVEPRARLLRASRLGNSGDQGWGENRDPAQQSARLLRIGLTPTEQAERPPRR